MDIYGVLRLYVNPVYAAIALDHRFGISRCNLTPHLFPSAVGISLTLTATLTYETRAQDILLADPVLLLNIVSCSLP